jgi:DNA-binding NtrC family response regulator
MAGGNNMLLICEQKTSSWSGVLAVALAPFGHLRIASVNEALDLVRQQSQQLVIIDAACVQDAPALVTQIRAIRPGTRVVVATASPTWQRARDVFRAGATDYIRKSLSKQELQETFAGALSKTPPP